MMNLFFYYEVDWRRPKMANFGPKMVKHGRFINVPKWYKMVQKGPRYINITVLTEILLGSFGPIRTVSDKNVFFAPDHLGPTLLGAKKITLV